MNNAQIWEEEIVIPTYEIGEPDKNPMFLEKRVYQGSSGKIYPYPTTQVISREKTDKKYKAVFLENDYIKICILPELGGRIQRAYDKTNGYDFIYYNHVIKPALVGLLGPWISGGIEFNWPQHHRPTTFMPVSIEIKDNADGSVSLITGDIDRMYGTRECTTFTIYPDKSYIEIKGQLYNRTPFPQTFLWWANPAVAVNDNTQSVFPPDVHNVYDHGKRAVSTFPVATGEYYKHDYSEGVDISRYKNIPVPTSYMAEKSDYDFVGGYDYGKEAGLLHVADHHVSPGKKQWTWGCGDFGKAWDRNLTDSDGPYIELMTGMFCDNQPDFSWLQPFEEKTFTQYFMPYRGVGYVKNATKDACIGAEFVGGQCEVKVYATARHEKVLLTITYHNEKIFEEKISISPREVYENKISFDHDDVENIYITVSEGDRILVSYKPLKIEMAKTAEPAKACLEPREIQSNEELFLAAQHLEQYRHATWLPDPYYLEGLKRDPMDSRINDAYGLLLLKRGLFKESEPYFRNAIARLTQLTPNPYNSEPLYHLGLCLFYQGQEQEAFDTFYKATWSADQKENAYYFMAVIACRKGDFQEALEYIDDSLVRNTNNSKARALKAFITYKLEDLAGAIKLVHSNIAEDHFDLGTIFLGKLLGVCSEADLERAIAGNHENVLQIVIDLCEAGLYEEVLELLDLGPASALTNAIDLYYKSYVYGLLTDADKATQCYEAAERADSRCVFPNMLMDIIVLSQAIADHPDSQMARYYLGCIYYDKLQYERALELWMKASECGLELPTLYRNLAIVHFNKTSEKEKALEEMAKAFALDESDATIFHEYDQLKKKMNIAPAKRLISYEQHPELWKLRDDLYTDYVTLLNDTGEYAKALNLIRVHSFQTWEGAEGKITGQFQHSLYALAKKALDEGDARMCLSYVSEALSYPENLGEGHLEGSKNNHLYYLAGLAHDALGEQQQAQDSYRLATLGESDPAGVMYYYDQPADMILFQGLAYQKLGDDKNARSRFYKLLRFGQQHLGEPFKMDYFAVSMPDFSIFDEDMEARNNAHCYYICGLAYTGLGETDRAVAFFDKALEIEQTHQKAALYRKEIQR